MVDKKALVLFSGGLDSTTVLHHAISEGYKCLALTIDYNQRHNYEIQSSQEYLNHYDIDGSLIFNIDLTQIGGSALTDNEKIDVPIATDDEIPITYVPCKKYNFFIYSLSLC